LITGAHSTPLLIRKPANVQGLVSPLSPSPLPRFPFSTPVSLPHPSLACRRPRFGTLACIWHPIGLANIFSPHCQWKSFRRLEWETRPLSEVLSCQLEFKYLAYLTGRRSYYAAVENVMEVMYETNLSSSKDLLPTIWSTETGLPASSTSPLLYLVSVHIDGMRRIGLCWRACG